MGKYRLKIHNDIVYLFILLILTELFAYISIYAKGIMLFGVGILGCILLETWFIKAFVLYSKKKISKYSDVIVKISLRDRFFAYFILPLIFYISLLSFLFFNRNLALGQVILGVSMILFLILFLNVKSSLNKIYSVENATKAISDFICISILYLLTNILVRIGLGIIPFMLILAFITLILLAFCLKLHDRFGSAEFVIAFLSSLFISFITVVFWNTNIFIIPLISALAFYLVVSIWNIRFSGKIHFSDYIFPFLYVILALILILTI